MFFFFSFIPATIWVVLGYLILFSSTKAQGAVQAFGRVLAIWVFILAALSVIGGVYMTFSGLSPIGGMQSMHSRMSP